MLAKCETYTASCESKLIVVNKLARDVYVKQKSDS